MTIEEARTQVSRILPGVSAAASGADGERTLPPEGSLKPGRDTFPVPELALFVFRDILGMATYGPTEDLRWGVAFLFEGRVYALERRRHGFTVRYEQGCPGAEEAVADVVQRVRRAQLVAAQVLEIA